MKKRATTHFALYFCVKNRRIPCNFCKIWYFQKLWTRKISSKLLKLANPYISGVTSKIINRKVVFHDEWKNAQFSPVRKVDADNYRPISILPAFSTKSRESFTRKNSDSIRGRSLDLIEREVRGRHSARVGYK